MNDTKKSEEAKPIELTPKKEGIFSIARLLEEGTPTKLDFLYLRKCFVHKSFDYFITLGNKSSPVNSIYQSTKKFDITFSHGIRLINKWEGIGLLKKDKPKDARNWKVTLTQKGDRIRENFLKIQEALNDAEKDFPKIVKKIRMEKCGK